MTVVELEREVAELQERVAWLERAVGRPGEQPTPTSVQSDKPSSGQELIALLKQRGVIRDPLPEEEALAEEWRRLPEAEKQAVLDELNGLPPGPMLSDLVIQNRG